MERVIELITMPAMQMSILNKIELVLHCAVIGTIFTVLFLAIRKVLKGR